VRNCIDISGLFQHQRRVSYNACLETSLMASLMINEAWHKKANHVKSKRVVQRLNPVLQQQQQRKELKC